MFRPNTTKKIAANRSRNGESTRVAFSAVSSEIAMPSRNAPTPAETCSCEAMPATSSAMPRTRSRKTSEVGDSTTADTARPNRSATTSTTISRPTAIATVRSPATRPSAASAAVVIGR